MEDEEKEDKGHWIYKVVEEGEVKCTILFAYLIKKKVKEEGILFNFFQW